MLVSREARSGLMRRLCVRVFSFYFYLSFTQCSAALTRSPLHSLFVIFAMEMVGARVLPFVYSFAGSNVLFVCCTLFVSVLFVDRSLPVFGAIRDRRRGCGRSLTVNYMLPARFQMLRYTAPSRAIVILTCLVSFHSSFQL